MKQFDLIVIGSGSGLDVAIAAANYGLKVAIIEKDSLGGTCLNRGCIPSKMLIHSADVAETIDRASLFGINFKEYQVDFPAIVKKVTDEIDSESASIENALRSESNPMLFKGTCKFVGDKVLQVGEETLIAEKFLIACGSRANVPSIPGLNESGYITSDQALRLTVQPKVLTILGGGYIAAELAHFFGSLGTEINIIQRNKLLVPLEDSEISEQFTHIMSHKYNVLTGYEPIAVSKQSGDFEVAVENVVTKERKMVKSDQLLVATGRIPNSDLLDLEKTGVKTDEKGNIVTDAYLETNVLGVFALGDVIGRFPFKHAANLEAEYALQNLLMPDQKIAVDYAAMPHAIFSSPQIAGVGKTEQQLKAENANYVASKWNYIDSGMGQAIEDRTGFVKILIDQKTLNILGCHIIGTDASTLIHEVIIAMRCGSGSIMNILGAVHIHPALSEIVKRAASNLPLLSHEHEHEHDHNHDDEHAHSHDTSLRENEPSQAPHEQQQ